MAAAKKKGKYLGGLLLNDITYLCIGILYKGYRMGGRELLNVYWQMIFIFGVHLGQLHIYVLKISRWLMHQKS